MAGKLISNSKTAGKTAENSFSARTILRNPRNSMRYRHSSLEYAPLSRRRPPPSRRPRSYCIKISRRGIFCKR
jgi:hypothetical protein